MTWENGDVTDEAIVARFRETGDHCLFEVVVARHRDDVYRTVRRLVSDADDAADLTQEVFVKAYFGLKQFQARASLRTWLHRIAVNHCPDYLSRTPRPDSLAAARDSELAAEHGDPDVRLHVKSCLAELSGGDRLVLLLKYVEEPSPAPR